MKRKHENIPTERSYFMYFLSVWRRKLNILKKKFSNVMFAEYEAA